MTTRARAKPRVVAKPAVSDFAKEFAEPPAIAHSCTSKVCAVLRDRTPEEEKLLRAALDDPRWRHIDILRKLKAQGYQVGESTIKYYRAHGCRCNR